MTEDHPVLPSSQQDRRVPRARRAGTPRLARMATPLMAVAVATALAACSSGGGSAQHPAGHATASARPQASETAIPTGNQLSQILSSAPLPAGWSHAQGAGNGEFNSGSMFDTPYGPPRAQDNCSTLDSDVSSFGVIGWWASSYDAMVLTYPGDPANLPQVNLAAGAYKPGYAAKTMAFTAALIGRCHSFRDVHLGGDPVTTSVQRIPHLGVQNLLLTSAERTSSGVITAHMILVQAGDDIAGADSNTAVDGDVRPATIQGFAAWLLRLMQSKSA